MAPLLVSKSKRYMFYGFTLGLMALSVGLLITKAVVVKMLPYDNKSELQIVIDMPEGTPKEKTLETAKAIADYIAKQSIVKDYQIYVGTSSPFNFNGLVRHYYLRQGSNMADIQVNLVDKKERKDQSHDFAKKIRPAVHEIAKKYGAKYVAVVEVPPGPPVLSPIVAEVYGPDLKSQEAFALQVLDVFKKSPSITDEGIYLESPHKMLVLRAKDDVLKLVGMSKEEFVHTLTALLGGYRVGLLQNTDTEHTPIIVQLKENYRSLELLKTLKVPTKDGKLVPVSELVEILEQDAPKSIYRKNLRRVVYVIGDVAGREEAPFYGILDVRKDVLSIPHLTVRRRSSG
jgi:multidrug efflux pump subunit AcrB